jgi:hypothetical protein
VHVVLAGPTKIRFIQMVVRISLEIDFFLDAEIELPNSLTSDLQKKKIPYISATVRCAFCRVKHNKVVRSYKLLRNFFLYLDH